MWHIISSFNEVTDSLKISAFSMFKAWTVMKNESVVTLREDFFINVGLADSEMGDVLIGERISYQAA